MKRTLISVICFITVIGFFGACTVVDSGDVEPNIAPPNIAPPNIAPPNIAPPNIAPVAIATATNFSLEDATVNQTSSTSLPITFDASGSYDPDGAVMDYHWDFGDGVDGWGEIVFYNFGLNPGTYIVTLSVTDNIGDSDTDIIEVTVNDSPIAVVTAKNKAGTDVWGVNSVTITSPERIPVDFDAIGSTDIDGVIVNYHWDFGDGNTSSGISSSVSYDFGKVVGVYTVTLTVTDNLGGVHSVFEDVTVTGGT